MCGGFHFCHYWKRTACWRSADVTPGSPSAAGFRRRKAFAARRNGSFRTGNAARLRRGLPVGRAAGISDLLQIMAIRVGSRACNHIYRGDGQSWGRCARHAGARPAAMSAPQIAQISIATTDVVDARLVRHRGSWRRRARLAGLLHRLYFSALASPAPSLAAGGASGGAQRSTHVRRSVRMGIGSFAPPTQAVGHAVPVVSRTGADSRSGQKPTGGRSPGLYPHRPWACSRRWRTMMALRSFFAARFARRHRAVVGADRNRGSNGILKLCPDLRLFFRCAGDGRCRRLRGSFGSALDRFHLRYHGRLGPAAHPPLLE